MRNPFRRMTGRRMARPLAGQRAGPGPRLRVLLGWAAAAALVAVIAFVVGLPGPEDETPQTAGSSSAASTLPITFGTALDAGSGEATEVTDRFAAGDLFAYSVRLSEPVGREAVEVEVLRTDAGTLTVVQAASPQAVSSVSRVIAFSVSADELLAAFGDGQFLMRIYGNPNEAPLAEGQFRLINPG